MDSRTDVRTDGQIDGYMDRRKEEKLLYMSQETLTARSILFTCRKFCPAAIIYIYSRQALSISQLLAKIDTIDRY